MQMGIWYKIYPIRLGNVLKFTLKNQGFGRVERDAFLVSHLIGWGYENSADYSHPVVSLDHLSSISTELPVSTDMFTVCDGGDRPVWPSKGKLVITPPYSQVPSLSSWWL
jgi:hypothetical protein